MPIAIASKVSLLLAGCTTLDLDSDRAAEQRRQELCRDRATFELPHCTGGRPSARNVPTYDAPPPDSFKNDAPSR